MDWSFLPQSIGKATNGKYAVVIFLPDRLQEIIIPLREKYDPIYNVISPHVTLVYPFETDVTLTELVSSIEMETIGRPPITIQLSSIGDFYPNIPKIYWTVSKNESLTELYYRLHQRLGVPVPYKEYLPHVTVAREISFNRVFLVKERVASYLPDERFEAKAIDLIAPLSDDRWVSVRTFSLKP